MSEFILKLLNMSISASWLALAVLILRLLFRKMPKWITVLLWGLVAVRLVLPFSLESAFSLLPTAETIPMNIAMERNPAVDTGIGALNQVINPIISMTSTPNPAASANPLQIFIPIFANLWLLGAVALLLYAGISSFLLYRKVRTAVKYKDNIYQSDRISSPFVWGMVKPKIYSPFTIGAQEIDHVIAHEQAHIKRLDHLWKPLGFLVLTLHWFNPLLWFCYFLFVRDIEMACDEKVIRSLENETRADYTQALVNCSVKHHSLAACPLAFGEISVKERVKKIMNYKKPTTWIIICAVVVCAVVAVCFLTNPAGKTFKLKITVPAGSMEPFVYANEQICPTRDYIIVSTGDGLSDTSISIVPIEVSTETAYDTTPYLTPGMPVKMEVEKGGWFSIGINMQNNTDENKEVYIEVKNVEVRIVEYANPIEQYRTDYLGDAVNVTKIAQLLPYPKGYKYSSVELQTSVEPYEMIVYVTGDEEIKFEDFAECAEMAFDLIGNMDAFTLRGYPEKRILASYTRPGYVEKWED